MYSVIRFHKPCIITMQAAIGQAYGMLHWTHEIH